MPRLKNKKLELEYTRENKPEYYIEYEDAPTGYVYIGCAKKPLMKNKSGYGFRGVLLHDEHQKLIQCSECGKFVRRINAFHLKKCTGGVSTTEEYKDIYGLNKTSGLVSNDLSSLLAEAALKNKKGHKHFLKNQKKMVESGTKAYKKKYGETGAGFSTEFYNKNGNCELQLLTRLVTFVNENKELPAPGNRGRGIYKAIWRKYGSFGKQIEKWGFPTFERIGTTYRYVFLDNFIYSFNLNRLHDRSKLYKLMKEKCPVLSADNLDKYL